MSSPIKVNFEGLSAGQQGIQASYNQLVQTLDNLEHDLQPMVNEWSGDAKDAYFQQKKAWDEAANSLSVLLQGIGKAVGDANSNYQAAENAARNTWSA
jgi:early secretory antigenic target protein ESAT-6